MHPALGETAAAARSARNPTGGVKGEAADRKKESRSPAQETRNDK